jgi:DnaA regulatory inactivator Hda
MSASKNKEQETRSDNLALRPHVQLPLDLMMRPALGREDFLIGPANKDAIGWIEKWPNWPAPALILSGPAASGKTHLAAVWQEKNGAANISPDQLIADEAEHIAAQAEHLIIDGLDPWLGDRDAETTLFHLYNIFKEEGRSLLLTMRMAPNQTEFAVADLASRLRAAPVGAIHPPDDDLLASVLIKQFYDRQLTLSQDVLRYIVPRMERSFSAVRDIVASADKKALSEKRAISVPLMRDVLAELQS